MSAGGRYLFIRCASANYNELRLLDLENRDRCIWSLDFGTISEGLRTDQSKVHFGFEVLRDGGISLAIAATDAGIGFEDTRRSIMVLHLHPTSYVSSPFEQTLVISSELHATDRFDDIHCAVSEKFVAFLSDRELAIVNSDEKRIVKLHFPMLNDDFGRGKIWNDYLFFPRRNQDRKLDIYALDLTQSMGASNSSITVTEASPSLISRFNPMDYMTDELASTSDLWNVVISLYDHSYSNETNFVTVSVMGVMWNYSLPYTGPDSPPEYLFSLVDFNKNERKWTHVRTHISDIPVENDASKPWISRRTGLSCSGRRLISFVGHGLKERDSLVAVDNQGGLVFPRLSENIAFMNTRKNGGDTLHDYVEPYSGTLIRLKQDQSGKDVIELYHPA